MSGKQIRHGSHEGLTLFSSPFNFVFFSFASVAEPGGFPSSRGLTPVSSVRGKAFITVEFQQTHRNASYSFVPSFFPLESGIRKNPFCGFILCLPYHLALQFLQEWVELLSNLGKSSGFAYTHCVH